jgi:hypothetical protein
MWSKIDGTIAHHPKLTAAGPVAAWYYVCGLTFATTYGTDGLIPDADALFLTSIDDPQAAIKRLVAVGLWHRCKGGYQIHDFLDYQQPAAKMKAGRAAGRRRQAEYRRRQAEQDNALRNAERDGSSNGVTNASRARTESEEEEELRVNPAPLPPTPVASEQDEARAPESGSVRRVLKPKEIDRAQIESHALFGALVAVPEFGPLITRELDMWRANLAALDELGALPEDIPRAAAAYPRVMGTDNGRPLPLTLPALVNNWRRCMKPTALAPPPRAPGDHRMPINGELKRDDFTGAGQYAHIFNRPYDDDTPLEELEREMLMQGDDVTRHAATP